MVAVVVLALSLALVPRPAWAGWGARSKAKPPTTGRSSKARRSSRARRSTGKSRAAKVRRLRTRQSKTRQPKIRTPLDLRVERLLSKRRWRPRQAIVLMREAVSGRDMAIALRLARAIADARRVSPADLVDAATILGQDQRYAVQLKLWRRVGSSRRVPRWLRRTVDDGWFDALMAAGKHQEARRVITGALRRARIGMRYSLYERLLAWGRVADQLDEVRETLLASRDPDATVLVARLIAELDGETPALTLLRAAFKHYPGHRRLQKALIDTLVRQGDRTELAKVVAKVVRLARADPMPWLKVVDAHILVRDKRAARKLIDRLSGRYPRHDVLIEALIDREQRLGENRPRLTKLFNALIRSNPRNSSYLEAYGEWLLTLGRKSLPAAMAILTRLQKQRPGPYDGMRRMASILQAHGHTQQALALLLRMQKRFPERPDTLRLLSILYSQTGRKEAAEKGWLLLTTLPERPDHSRRRVAANARRSLIALYRKSAWLRARRMQLARQLQRPSGDLGAVLLYLEMVASEAEFGGAQLADSWLKNAADAARHPMAAKWAADPEVATALAQQELWLARLDAAFLRIKMLFAVDADAARGLLMIVVERALRARKIKLVAAAEGLITSGSGVVASQLLRLGDLHMRAGDSAGASALFRRAARDNPRDTRPILRLARMSRQRGDLDAEAASLRAIVLRTVDADELNRAGQRLLTLAMRAGSAAELLLWLDAVTPKHPRRAVIERFRLLAYDVWLRTAPLERLLGHKGKQPSPAMLTEAMGSGDLALRVRALRQAALAHRRLPAALARRLLKDDSPVIRRLTVLALAAANTLASTKVLVEMEAESDWQVRVAQLFAFAQLPAVPEAEPFLVSRLQEINTAWSSLAGLAVGRVGGGGAVHRLLAIAKSRAALRPALTLALGALIGRLPQHGRGRDVVDSLAQWSIPTQGPRMGSYFVAYTAFWALAASGRADAHRILLDRIVDAPGAVLRGLAIRLAGAAKPPTLLRRHWQVRVNWSKRYNVAVDIERRVLMRWLTPDPAVTAAALARLDAELAPRLRRRFAAADGAAVRIEWCAHVADLLTTAPRLRALCGTAVQPEIRPAIRPIIQPR